ncbi:helix-turn-helix domain-containing protein [Sporosalibacterium faouarense]|uniref:helix-turn-helix domain-containing protein n=1 Tax=Sporosalibacterium faouarense TaxID=516123 RepID=UPI00192AD2EE|nr:helix-turn-helix transcriptional regulator [Sporosalibacterium faouarense]
MATFGERFKELRKEKNLTQEKLAVKFYLNKSSISRYEQNKQIPEIDLLEQFSDFFNVSIDYLLGKSDIRNLNDKVKTMALHRTDGYADDLPEEAQKELEEYLKYLRHKYKK